MPEYGAFLKGFGIHRGLTIDSWKLGNIKITHNVIKQYQEYNYDIILVFEHNRDGHQINHSQFISKLKKYVQGNEIIKTRYGNPFECNFGQPKIIQHNDNQIIVKSIGTAFRVYFDIE